MGDYDKALQNILENLSNGHGTNIDDWSDIMNQLVGANCTIVK